MSTYWYAVNDARRQYVFLVGQHARPVADHVILHLLDNDVLWAYTDFRLVGDFEDELEDMIEKTYTEIEGLMPMFVHEMYDGRLPHGGRHAAIKSIERRCGPAATWAGRCQEIASAFIVDDLVEGALTVGMWTGAVASGVPTTPGPGGVVHGWITREDGSVVDPTRFVFEGRAPYVYIGKADPHYVAMGAVAPRG